MGGRFGSIQARSVKRTHKWVCHVVPAYPNVSPGPMNGSILLRWSAPDWAGYFVATAYNLVRMANLLSCQEPRAVQSV